MNSDILSNSFELKFMAWLSGNNVICFVAFEFRSYMYSFFKVIQLLIYSKYISLFISAVIGIAFEYCYLLYKQFFTTI